MERRIAVDEILHSRARPECQQQPSRIQAENSVDIHKPFLFLIKNLQGTNTRNSVKTKKHRKKTTSNKISNKTSLVGTTRNNTDENLDSTYDL